MEMRKNYFHNERLSAYQLRLMRTGNGRLLESCGSETKSPSALGRGWRRDWAGGGDSTLSTQFPVSSKTDFSCFRTPKKKGFRHVLPEASLDLGFPWTQTSGGAEAPLPVRLNRFGITAAG
jgi:hypothetical protein